MARNGTANLIPFNRRSKEEQKAIQSKGGKKSVETRRMQRTFREIGMFVLGAKPPEDVLDIFCKRFPNIPREEMNYKLVAYLAQLNKAINLGDTQAFDRLFDVSGEKEVQVKVESTNTNIGVDLSNVKTDDLLKMVEKAGSKIDEQQ